MNKGIMLQYPTPYKKKSFIFWFCRFELWMLFFHISPWRINFKSLVKDLAIREPEHFVF